VKEFPTVAIHGNCLAYSHHRRGLARRALGNSAGATADAQRAIVQWDGLPSRTEEDCFETAATHASLADSAG
jgi:hypothetical protein